MSSIPSEPQASTLPRAEGGKYLVFRLGLESYGVNVLNVRHIIRMLEITPVPRMAPYVRGVINLRGKVIPMIDLRLKFGLGEAEIGERTCTLVVETDAAHGGKALTGLIVDSVVGVDLIAASDIDHAPDFGAKLQTDHILGMAGSHGIVKALLNIDHVVSADGIHPVPHAHKS